ncbi:MAG: hypothetical protein HRT89_02575, partial [Lentisphaeria bacterium]|nr:hypothetical protein [Lentisphaeria bacterium]NQZ66933.1 hypothetical protein [Lentisphaeria bacterium]
MKKIIFLDQGLAAGGAEKILCTIMASLDKKSYDIHLVLTNHLSSLAHLVPDHVTVHELHKTHTRKSLVSLMKLFRKLKPDLVFSSLSRSTILSVITRLLCSRYKIIGRYPNMPSREISEGVLSGWRLFLNKTLLKRVDKVIAQTDEMK